MEEISYLKSGATAPDGNIYALPAVNECFHCSRYGKMWINTESLEKLDLEMPTTTDEFRDALRAFKNNDPNGNGKKDEIPLSGETVEVGNSPNLFLMNAFIHSNGKDYINVKNGELSLAPMQPEWKEGLEYIHSLYKEGLIDAGTYTQNMEALKQIGTPDGDPLLGASAASHLAVFMDLANEKSASYDVVPPIKGPNGAQYTTANYGNVDTFTFAITEKAKGEKAEALIKLADFLYSEEGTILATKGKEGVTWKKGDPEDIDLNGKQAKYATIQKEKSEDEEEIYYSWGERGPIMLTRELKGLVGSGYRRMVY